MKKIMVSPVFSWHLKKGIPNFPAPWPHLHPSISLGVGLATLRRGAGGTLGRRGSGAV